MRRKTPQLSRCGLTSYIPLSLAVDDCAARGDVACGAHGTCVDGFNDFTCNCDTGYYGDHCENGK